MDINWAMVGLGCVGGAIPDVIRLAQGRYKNELPGYLMSANFWIGFVLVVALGGLAAALGGATAVTQALGLGYAAPELVTKLLSSHEVTAARPVTAGRLRRFWAY